jgi:hypothetical protein
MWPVCINNLSPRKYLANEEITEILKDAFKKALKAQGKLHDNDPLIPVRLVSLLGKCTMSEYPDIPNTPIYHSDQDEWDDPEAFVEHLRYLECEWVDFDIIDANHQFLPLRMVFNWGDGDTNDGFWGAVWERNTEELVANILSTGDCETTIEAVSKQYIDRYQSQETLIPIDDDYELEFDNPELTSASQMWASFFVVYANQLEIEKLIGLALRLRLAITSASVEDATEE